jgi:hypothetical protein
MNDVNIWGEELDKNKNKSKNYVGYIPSNYENYGFKISAARYWSTGNSKDVEEPFELDNGGYSTYEFIITCPDSVKMWKFSYKLSSTTSTRMSIYPLKYILKGSNDNISWNTLYSSFIIERIFTWEEFRMPASFIKSIFPNILIENPKSYKYYSFVVTINVRRDHIPIDQVSMAVTVSNFQLYIMND